MAKKNGRNKDKCKKYKLEGRREKNKEKNILNEMKRQEKKKLSKSK